MNGRRRPLPRTLRTRLVVAPVALIAVIGTVTTPALRSRLYEQLDGQVREAAMRAAGGPVGGRPLPEPLRQDGPLGFVTEGPQGFGVIGTTVEDGRVTEGVVSNKKVVNGVTAPEAGDLTDARPAALGTVPRDHDEHTVDVPGPGGYRVAHQAGNNGTFRVALPTAGVDSTINTLILVEISVTAAGLVAVSPAGAAIVGVATRPLRRVAATATRVAEPPHRGEVIPEGRVPPCPSATRTPRPAGSAPR